MLGVSVGVLGVGVYGVVVLGVGVVGVSVGGLGTFTKMENIIQVKSGKWTAFLR